MIRKHISSKAILVRPNDKHWFNSEIRRYIRIRNRLHSVHRKTKTNHALIKYKFQRNKVNNMIKYAREQFFLGVNELVDSISKTDSKAYWSLIKKLLKRTNSSYNIPPLSDSNLNETVYNDKDKANLLNEYFCSISSVDDTNHDAPIIIPRTNFSLSDLVITEQDIKDILKTLKIGKGCGNDLISHQMLKGTAESVYKPLLILFNNSLQAVITRSDKEKLVLGIIIGASWLVSSTDEIEQKYSFERFALSLSMYTVSFKLLSESGGIL
ncbi:unnamed protein product [Mytilus coruscus]|uniref:Uncharacterized protein n=1 Tax=Mytilus coruscus TaxID=42192 RepID=A0A6J7ZWK4_MYTCO|nr:unnamed protein product [Mytilus coruscus]